MFRSQEILQIFTKKNLPEDISKYILELERKIIFQESIYQMIYNSYLFHSERSKRFFYLHNKINLLNQIKEIDGNTKYLKKYCEKLYHINRENKISSIYVNSLRF
tara:strand:+ start:95 stop:409 length:315 start_codon:yes stop_codon:yes gene_type:complete